MISIRRAIVPAAVVAALAVTLTMTPTGTRSGEVNVAGAGGIFNVPITSIKERRFRTVVQQKYDFSCGAAAIATVLTFHYNKPTKEKEVFKVMFKAGDQPTIRTKGFSMLDMKRYLDGLGYHSDGFRLKLERLHEIGVPVVTLVNIRGYHHFVVVKGMANGKVVVGDPAFGNSVMDQDKFAAIWSGTVLAIRDNPREARKQFNKAEDWNIRPRAPIGSGVGRTGVSSFTLDLPARVVF